MDIAVSINKVDSISKIQSIQLPLGFTCKSNILVIASIYIISHKYNHLSLVFTSFHCAYFIIMESLLFLICYLHLGRFMYSFIYLLIHKLHEAGNTDLFCSWLEECLAYNRHPISICWTNWINGILMEHLPWALKA